MKIVWRLSTRNHHVGDLNGEPVCAVVRPQKHRHDGTPHDWRIEILGTNRYRYSETFRAFDPRDLEAAKQAAEARTKWVIDCLYAALYGNETT